MLTTFMASVAMFLHNIINVLPLLRLVLIYYELFHDDTAAGIQGFALDSFVESRFTTSFYALRIRNGHNTAPDKKCHPVVPTCTLARSAGRQVSKS